MLSLHSIIIQIIAAISTTLGFGILFHVKGKNLFYTSFAGGLSWAVYLFCQFQNYNLSFSYFLPTFLLAFYSEIIAKKKRTPVTSIIIPAMIPLAPGGGIYYTMFYAIHKNYPLSIAKGMDTFIIAASMAIGVFSASALLRVYQELRCQFRKFL